MLVEEIDRGSIEKVVRKFYTKVLQDEVLAPFFIRALGTDMKNDKWYEHLIMIDNFWLGIMLKEGKYRGDPLIPHIFIGGLTPEIFDQWLKLFKSTLEEVYTPSNVRKFYGKAKGLAKRFMTDLELTEEDE
jgi:hemoglobin